MRIFKHTQESTHQRAPPVRYHDLRHSVTSSPATHRCVVVIQCRARGLFYPQMRASFVDIAIHQSSPDLFILTSDADISNSHINIMGLHLPFLLRHVEPTLVTTSVRAPTSRLLALVASDLGMLCRRPMRVGEHIKAQPNQQDAALLGTTSI